MLLATAFAQSTHPVLQQTGISIIHETEKEKLIRKLQKSLRDLERSESRLLKEERIEDNPYRTVIVSTKHRLTNLGVAI